MAKKNKEDYLVIRITSQETYISLFTYDNGRGEFNIKYYFSFLYNFNFQGVGVNEYVATINSELNKRDIRTKKVIFEIFSHDILVNKATTIKQKSYLENQKVIESTIKQGDSLIEKSNISLSYTVINEFTEKVEVVNDDVQTTKKKKSKQKKGNSEVTKIETLSYSTPIEVLNLINNIAELLKKEILYIDFAPRGVYNYYHKYIANQNDCLCLVHISTDCSIISIIQNGILTNQMIDNFGYMGMQTALSMYKTSLKSNLSNVNETVQTINNTFLYTIEKSDLDKIPQLNAIEKEQILEAKNVLIEYTLDFLERINIILNRERKLGCQFYGIYVYHDNATFPDLSSTISENLSLPVQNLILNANVLKGAERLPSINYLLTTLGGIIDPLQLDYRLLQKKKNSQLAKKVLYGILFATLFNSIGIIAYFMGSYIYETNRNNELNQKLLEAKEAQEVYNKYMSVSTAKTTLEEFKESNTSDLSDLDEQINKIASIMPKHGLKLLSMTANSGSGSAAGGITLSVEAESKDIMAKFILGLEEIDVFEKVEQTGVSDSMGDGDRKVSGTIVCSYEPKEEPAPAEDSEGTESTEETEAPEDMPIPEG